MSQGFAYCCDRCKRMEFALGSGPDKLGRFTEPNAGWIALMEIVESPVQGEAVSRGPERHFCSRECLLGWLWEEAK